MKNDFTNIFKAINPTEQEEFRHYIAHFYPQQKVILNTFERAANAVVNNAEEGFLSGIKNDKKILNDLSDLKRWLHDFLTHQEIKANSYEAKFLTLEALEKRGLKDALQKKSKELNKDLSDHPSPDIWLSLMKLRLAHSNYFSTENDKLDDFQVQMQLLLSELDNFYISTKLKYSAELQSRANLLQEEYTPRLLNEILSLVEKDAALSPTIKALYLPLLMLIKDKSETAYFQLKAFLIKNKPHDAREKLSILVYLLNYTTYRMTKGDIVPYRNEYFELSQIGLDQSLFTVAGYFPTRTFNNIVNVTLMVKGYNWTKKFIETWSIHLNPDDKFIAHNLALARLNFGEKNFQITIDYLQKLDNHKNIHFLVEIKSLLARAYYEQKIEVSRQNAHCDSFELQVRRVKRINENLRRSTLNFIKILRFLINEKPKNQIISALNKKDEIVMCHEWLKAKIEERKT
jgi:hypothetical protein